MSNMPRFQLSRLREIGWSKWDPIGVGGPEHDWPSDEYDTYLLQAAGQLWHGQPIRLGRESFVRALACASLCDAGDADNADNADTEAEREPAVEVVGDACPTMGWISKASNWSSSVRR